MIKTILLCLFGISLLAANTAAFALDCPVPKPFQQLDVDTAKSYDFDAIMTSLTNKAQLSEHHKKRVSPTQLPKIMNFWAVWCAPCREELPLLETIGKQQLADIQLINIGDDMKVAAALLNELNISYLPNENADSELLSELSLAGLPATIVWHQSSVYLGMGKLKDKAALKNWLTCLK